MEVVLLQHVAAKWMQEMYQNVTEYIFVYQGARKRLFGVFLKRLCFLADFINRPYMYMVGHSGTGLIYKLGKILAFEQKIPHNFMTKRGTASKILVFAGIN